MKCKLHIGKNYLVIVSANTENTIAPERNCAAAKPFEGNPPSLHEKKSPTHCFDSLLALCSLE